MAAEKTTKKVTAKPATKKTETVKKTVAVKEPKTEKAESSLTITMVDTQGKPAGSITLPEAIFGAKINPVLMAQAVRVYLANQRQGNATTKTRGEVAGSTRKIYRQKGTGRARHGAVRAPIFVKGGIAHGPKLRDYSLTLPAKMKKAALFSALSAQAKDGNIIVVADLEKAGEKTKKMAAALKNIGAVKKSLVVMPKVVEKVYRAGRNIENVSFAPVSELSTYAVLHGKKVVFMQEAVEALTTGQK